MNQEVPPRKPALYSPIHSPGRGLSNQSSPDLDRVTVPSILRRKSFRKQSQGKRISGPQHAGNTPPVERIVALTAYDYTMAQLLDAAGVDLILVGDSVATVIQGHETTLPATLDEMIYHAKCVTRGVRRALVVGDLPFLSYQPSVERGIEAAGRLLKEGGVAAVKLEGGEVVADLIARITSFDIPVMAHIGLTPQSFHRMGGHKQQGRTRDKRKAPGSRDRVIADARAVAEAGAFAVVVEGVPADLAAEITDSIDIPTIGIGAGAHCDGQILVTQDMLGMIPHFRPAFVKRYEELGSTITAAVQRYREEVRAGVFPARAPGSHQLPTSQQAGSRISGLRRAGGRPVRMRSVK